MAGENSSDDAFRSGSRPTVAATGLQVRLVPATAEHAGELSALWGECRQIMERWERLSGDVSATLARMVALSGSAAGRETAVGSGPSAARGMTDVATTPRRRLTARERLQVWERTGGVCVVCARQIDGVREAWIVEHMRALELGGVDDVDNMGPAHLACAQEKTRADHKAAAKAKRVKARHLGISTPRSPLPGGKKSRWKRKVTGEVVPR